MRNIAPIKLAAALLCDMVPSAPSILSAAEPQASTAAAPAGSHRPVTEFEVAEIRLRGSPAEVRTALTRAGYRIDYTGDATSFAQQVASEAARRRGLRDPGARNAGVGIIQATGPHQESLIVKFMQAPAGSEVSDVSLSVPQEAITGEAFRRQLLERYGRPDSSRANGSELAWCSPETLANCGRSIAVSGPLDNHHPLLTAAVGSYGGGGSLRLEIGETAFPRLGAAREAAVERLVPKTDRAAF